MTYKSIDHILWTPPPHEGTVYGILDVSIYYHGGDVHRVIFEGKYVFQKYPQSDYVESIFGKLDSETLGISGVSLNRIGEILHSTSS